MEEEKSAANGGGSGSHGRGVTSSTGAERFFGAPKNSEVVDGGRLRDYVPAGLRSSARQSSSSLRYDPLYGGAPEASMAGMGMAMLPVDSAGGVGRGEGRTASAAAAMSVMSPVFHFTSHDTTIVAMEHNNHCRLLALSTSKNEVFVTLTQSMPVVEDAAAAMGQSGPTLDERLQGWDPAAMTVLVDRLSFPCTQLRWAPWQHGVYLVGICPGKEVRVYRYSHGRWTLDAAITEPSDCLAFALSAQFTLACACRQGRILLLTRRAVPGEEKAWTVCHRYSPSPPSSARGGEAGGRRHEPGAGPVSGGLFGDCLAVDFDESGSLLAAVDLKASVRVYGVSNEGKAISHVAFAKDSALGKRSGSGGFRQVAWSPSAGRSFLVLAVVFSSRIHLWIFRRPRHLNAAGMSMNAGAAAGGGGGRSSGGGQPLVQLQLLAESRVLCEEVAKLSWNTTGTRFVTSHSDSSVHVWALDVTYQQAQPAPLAVLLQGGGSDGCVTKTASSMPVGGDSAGAGGGARPDQKLNLVVAVRQVSSVYPYHALHNR